AVRSRSDQRARDRASPEAPASPPAPPEERPAPTCRHTPAERRSHSVLTQFVEDLSHRTLASGPLGLQRRPTTDTLRRPNDRQGRGRRVERNDAAHRDSAVRQHEGVPLAYSPEHASRLVAQLAL